MPCQLEALNRSNAVVRLPERGKSKQIAKKGHEFILVSECCF